MAASIVTLQAEKVLVEDLASFLAQLPEEPATGLVEEYTKLADEDKYEEIVIKALEASPSVFEGATDGGPPCPVPRPLTLHCT